MKDQYFQVMCEDNVYSTDQLKTYYRGLKKIENRLHAAMAETQEKKTNILMHRRVTMRDVPIQYHFENAHTVTSSLNKMAVFIDCDVNQGQEIDICIKRIGRSIDSMVEECCDLVDAICNAYDVPLVNHKRIEDVTKCKNACLENYLKDSHSLKSYIARIQASANKIRALLATYHDIMDYMTIVKF